MLDTDTIHTFDFHHPQRNFGEIEDSGRVPESEFADSFALAYKEKFSQVHAGTTKSESLFIREMPVSGSGIADLLVLSWRPVGLGCVERTDFDLSKVDYTVRAFEVKMSDWRGGLMQAFRYKYFSHAAILVMPKERLKVALSRIALFKAMGVGLWGFDGEANTIRQVYTPRPKQQHISKYVAQALARASEAASL